MENYFDQPHIKFLKKCMADDRSLLDADLVSNIFSAVPQYKIAVTQMLELKEAVLEQDVKWPVLVETQPEYDRADSYHTPLEDDQIVFRIRQQYLWATNEEYVKRFGIQSPLSPLVKLLLKQYQHRPGFDPAWLN